MIKQFAFLAVTLGVLMAACAPVLGQAEILGTAEILQALTALAETEAAGVSAVTGATDTAIEELAQPAETAGATLELPAIASLAAEPEVTFVDIFGDAEAQLQVKVVEPFILYHRDIPGPRLLTLRLEIQEGVDGYPYKAEAIFEEGITSGWLVAVSGGNVDWWLPECMVACTFSDTFRAAYPEIVAAAGG